MWSPFSRRFPSPARQPADVAGRRALLAADLPPAYITGQFEVDAACDGADQALDRLIQSSRRRRIRCSTSAVELRTVMVSETPDRAVDHGHGQAEAVD